MVAALCLVPALAGAQTSPAGAHAGDGDAQGDVARYQAAIARLQGEHGVYDHRLNEQLLGLGLAHQANGDHAAAVGAFKQSLQITRVNKGLHTLDQVPVLELMIESNQARRAWARVDDNFHYLYWIHRRSLGADSLELVPVLDRVARWHLAAYYGALDEQEARHVNMAFKLYTRAVAIMERHYGEYDQRLIEPLYGLAYAAHSLREHVGGQIAERLSRSRTSPTGENAWVTVYEPGEFRAMGFSEEVAHLRSYQAGRDALVQAIEIHARNPGLSPRSQAQAIAQLGDWYLINDRPQSAREKYEEAYRLLEGTEGSEEAVEVIFGQPRQLPNLRPPSEEEQAASAAARLAKHADTYVLATLDVTETGRARNIDIVESSPPDDVRLRRRASRAISNMVFRPRLQDGQPVTTRGMRLRYVDTDTDTD